MDIPTNPKGGAAQGTDALDSRAIEAIRHAFDNWLSQKLGYTMLLGLDGLAPLDHLFDAWPESSPPKGVLEHGAIWLGECVREGYGGTWKEDPIFGVVVCDFAQVPGLRFRAHDAMQKKWELRKGFSLAAFANKLLDRIEGERGLSVSDLPSPQAIAEMCSADPAGAAALCARALSLDWKSRFGAELPLSLRGVRELDRWLRTHYLVCGVTEAEMLCAGLFVGEVARGLFGGEWSPDPDPVRTALRFPELDYKPVGRIFKMMTELPEREPLEDYVRVIPSARRELRGGGE